MTRIELTHLADFFGQCHLGKQRVCALIDRFRFVFWFCWGGAHFFLITGSQLPPGNVILTTIYQTDF